MILSAWPIIPIILSVRSCYTLYLWLAYLILFVIISYFFVMARKIGPSQGNVLATPLVQKRFVYVLASLKCGGGRRQFGPQKLGKEWRRQLEYCQWTPFYSLTESVQHGRHQLRYILCIAWLHSKLLERFPAYHGCLQLLLVFVPQDLVVSPSERHLWQQMDWTWKANRLPSPLPPPALTWPDTIGFEFIEAHENPGVRNSP